MPLGHIKTAGAGGTGGAMVPPYFDGSVNPVSTRGDRFCPAHDRFPPPWISKTFLVPLGHIKTAGSEKAGENFVSRNKSRKETSKVQGQRKVCKFQGGGAPTLPHWVGKQ